MDAPQESFTISPFISNNNRNTEITGTSHLHISRRYQAVKYNISMESDRGTSEGAYTNREILEGAGETKATISNKTLNNDNRSYNCGKVS